MALIQNLTGSSLRNNFTPLDPAFPVLIIRAYIQPQKHIVEYHAIKRMKFDEVFIFYSTTQVQGPGPVDDNRAAEPNPLPGIDCNEWSAAFNSSSNCFQQRRDYLSISDQRNAPKLHGIGRRRKTPEFVPICTLAQEPLPIFSEICRAHVKVMPSQHFFQRNSLSEVFTWKLHLVGWLPDRRQNSPVCHEAHGRRVCVI